MIVAAIDSGVKNFALSIECVLDEALGMDVDIVSLCSETLFFHNYALDPEDPVRSVTRILDSLSEYWDGCDVVLVERQVQYRGVVNTAALRIAHHCLSYFSILRPSIKCIDYPSSNKTKQLGAPNGLTKPERKKWSIQYADNVLERRGDTVTQGVRKSMAEKRPRESGAPMGTKLDDVSDCMLMCLAYASKARPAKNRARNLNI
jgi:hypothetical protein